MYKTTTMKHILVFIALYWTGISLSQIITLDHTDYLEAGDTARLSQATDANIDYVSTGAYSVWDFAYLQAETQTLLNPFLVANASFLIQFGFGTFAPARYSSDYYSSYGGLPFDQLGAFLPVNIEDIFRFTKVEEDSISFTGYAMKVEGNEVPFQSDTIEVAMRFPMSYGDTNNSRAYSKLDFNPIFNGIFIQYRQRQTEVDGHGTLLTPYGNFNTIRVKHTIQEQDSLYADIFGFAGWIPLNLPTQYIYEWWAKGQSVPVMKIATQEINGSEVVTLIEYKDIYLGLTAQLDDNDLAVTIYPNPTQSIINISTNSPMEMMVLYSAVGKLVYQTEMNHSTAEKIDVSFLSQGSYLLGIKTTQGINFQKIVIGN